MEGKKAGQTEHKKRGTVGKIITCLAMIIMGGACGFFGMMQAERMFDGNEKKPAAWLMIASILILFYVSAYLQIVIHEGGHLIFGLLCGYHFVSFRVGSFMWIKKDGKIQLKRYSLMGTGGQCLMMPPSPYRENFPVMLYNMGGSITNLIVAGIFLLMNQFLHLNFVLAIFAMCMGIIGIIYAMLNGIQMSSGPVNNDGYNALHLGKSQYEKWGFWMQLNINALLNKGMRLKEMPMEWFQIPEGADPESSMIASVQLMEMSRFIDCHQFDRAAELGNQIMINTHLAPVLKSSVASEMIVMELLGENRKERIEELMTKEFKGYEKAMKKHLSLIRMQYAYELFQNNDEKAAQEKWKLFDKMKETYPSEGDKKSECELMEYIRNYYDSKRKTQAVMQEA